MKNKMKQRVLAGSMAVVVGVGLVGAYEYRQSAVTVHAEEETKELKEAAEEVLGDADTGADGELFKDEAVYVKADAAGNVKETTVTEWLKNPGNGEVPDNSGLDEIKNIKGEETFTQGNDGELTWSSEGEDIYYQGTTKKELPVEVKVSYKLDGKDISAEDLKGKDGKVEIHIDYVNNSKETVQVNGEEAEMYTPFTMVTALMLPTDEYKNVTIDNGKIVSDADKDIVVGLAFPGLKENLKLQELDVEIPESITITADVKNASVGPTMTMASSDIIEKLGLDDIQDFDSLGDSVDELDDAAKQLVDGSGELAEGAGTLNSKTEELNSGINELANGVNAYASGVSELAAGSEKLVTGADALKQGAEKAQTGINTAKTGADALMNGYDDQTQGAVVAAKGLSAGLGQLNEALGQTGSLTLTGEQSAQIEALAAGMAENAVKNIPEDAFETIGTKKADYKAGLSSAYAAELKTQFTNTMNQTATAVQGQIKGNVDKLAGVAGALAEGIGQLRAGTAELQGGLAQLSEGSDALVKGTGELYNGAYALQQGASKLNESSSLLTTGTQSLKDGGEQFAAGTSQLADGSSTLADGMSEFKTSGIDKLTELFHGDIKNVTDRIDAMMTLGENYKSFAGIKEGMNGSTKFIIETEGVE